MAKKLVVRIKNPGFITANRRERKYPGTALRLYDAEPQMQAHDFQTVRNAVSTPRLDVYRQAGDTDFDVLARYLWNVTLSESLYPVLQTLEVALRNTLHTGLAARFGTSTWYAPLDPQGQQAVAAAKQELAREQKPHDPGRVVAELNFGFWTSLLNSRYEQVIWPALLKPCFPYMPRTLRVRRNLSGRLNDIRKLRNRVFHHERIVHLPTLTRQHAEAIETIGWISPPLRDALSVIDRFGEVYTIGATAVRAGLAEMTGSIDYAV